MKKPVFKVCWSEEIWCYPFLNLLLRWDAGCLMYVLKEKLKVNNDPGCQRRSKSLNLTAQVRSSSFCSLLLTHTKWNMRTFQDRFSSLLLTPALFQSIPSLSLSQKTISTEKKGPIKVVATCGRMCLFVFFLSFFGGLTATTWTLQYMCSYDIWHSVQSFVCVDLLQLAKLQFRHHLYSIDNYKWMLWVISLISQLYWWIH